MCKVGTEEIRTLGDETLIFLLLAAIHRKDIDDLFAELYRRYHARVTCWCRRFVKNHDRADDMSQEIFLRAFRYRHSFRGDSRLSTWLYSITRNHCLTAMKKSGGDPSIMAGPLDPELYGSNGMETQKRIERAEAFSAIWRLIDTALTPTEARVMALHYGHELPLATITRHLMLSNPSGAKAYIVNAKRKLHAVLVNHGKKRTGLQRRELVRPTEAGCRRAAA